MNKKAFALIQGYETRDGCLGEIRGYSHTVKSITFSKQKAEKWVALDSVNRTFEMVDVI